jgi:hypothetical protein
MKRLTHEQALLDQYEKQWPIFIAVVVYYIGIFASSAPFLFLFGHAYGYRFGDLAFAIVFILSSFSIYWLNQCPKR